MDEPTSPLLSEPKSLTLGGSTLPPPSAPKPKPEWKVEPAVADTFAAWHADRTPQNGSKLLTAIDPYIKAAVKTYAADSGPTGYGRAKVTVMKSMHGYDPTRSSLRTFVTNQLQSLQRYRAGQISAVKVPERTLLMQNTLRKAESDLTDRLGRPPSASELADFSGVPAATISQVRKAKVALSEGAFTEGYDGDSEYGGDPAIRQTSDAGWTRLVYHSLDPKDQLVLEHTLGLFGAPVLSTQALAKRLGVSPAAVSQRKAKVQAILDKRDELKLI